MDAVDVAFDPEQYLRGFSDEQIVDHLVGTLRIVDQALNEHERSSSGSIAMSVDLVCRMFDVAQAMRAAMQPRNPARPPRIARAL